MPFLDRVPEKKRFFSGLGLFPVQVKHLLNRFERSFQPKRTTQPLWARCRTGFLKPTPIDLGGFRCVHKHITILVSGLGFFDPDFLMPAMHSADRIGVYCVGDVLMHPAIPPANAFQVFVFSLRRLDPGDDIHLPFS